MNRSSIPPISNQTYNTMIYGWMKIIKCNEMGLFIWSPLSGHNWRIFDFIKDRDTQKKKFGTNIPQFVYLDLKNEPQITTKQLNDELFYAIERSSQEGDKINSAFRYLLDSKKRKRKVSIFVTGVDRLIINQNFQPIKTLISQFELYTDYSLLLFVSTYIDIKKFKNELGGKYFSNENIVFQTLYTYEDCCQYIKYIENKWSIRATEKQKQLMLTQFQGVLGLIKNCYRILMENPKISNKELLANSSLMERGGQILSVAPYELIEGIQSGHLNTDLIQKHQDIIDYLTKTKMIQNSNNIVKFNSPYLQQLTIKKNQDNQVTKYQMFFSEKEERVYNVLLTSKNNLVTRFIIGEKIWGNEVDELYSDWAIDQLVHRIREKIKVNNINEKIITLKGKGFILMDI